MNSKLQSAAIGLLLSFNVCADGYSPSMTSQDQPWSITASFGNGTFQHGYKNEGNTAVGRLALSNELLLTGAYAWGVELGLQSGNHMRISIPKETLSIFKYLPVRTYLGPMIDLLITAKSDPLGASEFFAQLKGGVAYRNWQFKQAEFNELSKIAGEIQAGFGYPITALAELNLLYQGVFGGDPSIIINIPSQTARTSNIPVLHAILLGLSVNI